MKLDGELLLNSSEMPIQTLLKDYVVVTRSEKSATHLRITILGVRQQMMNLF